jgi:hypothetical protein
MLSWIFQAYADVFSVATFQPERPARDVDAPSPARFEAPGSIWQRRAPTVNVPRSASFGEGLRPAA